MAGRRIKVGDLKKTVAEAIKILGEKSPSPVDRSICGNLAKVDEEKSYNFLRQRADALKACGVDWRDIVPPKKKEEPMISTKEVWLDDGAAFVRSPDTPQLRRMLRMIPSFMVTYLKRKKAHRVRFVNGDEPDLGVINMLIQLGDNGYDISDEDIAEFVEWREKAIARENEKMGLSDDSRSVEAELEIEGITGTPRPYQIAGVSYLARAKRMILADDMGLGKTITALCSAQYVGGYPLLIVTKAALVINWYRETKKWLPGKRVSTDPREAGKIPVDIMITNYEKLLSSARYESLESVDWKMMVIDESTRIKNRATKGAKNCRDLARVSKCEYRMCLSGTPVDNGPHDYLGPLVFLDRMNVFGGDSRYQFRYCGGFKKGSTPNRENFPELLATLEANCYMRRRKKDVLKELPPKQLVELPAQVDESLHRDLEQEILAEHMENPGVAVSLLRRAAAMAIMDWAEEWISQVVENGEKLIVFAHHVDVQKEIYSRFKSDAVWTRAEKDHQKAIDEFQRGSAKVIVCSLSADSEGHNLTAGSNVFMLECPWTSTRLDQAIDRAHRMGQKDSVTGWIPVAENTIQPHILNIINEKRIISDSLVDGEDSTGEMDSNAKIEAFNRYTKNK